MCAESGGKVGSHGRDWWDERSYVTSGEMSTGLSILAPLRVPLSYKGGQEGSSHKEFLGVASEEQQEVFPTRAIS